MFYFFLRYLFPHVHNNCARKSVQNITAAYICQITLGVLGELREHMPKVSGVPLTRCMVNCNHAIYALYDVLLQ